MYGFMAILIGIITALIGWALQFVYMRVNRKDFYYPNGEVNSEFIASMVILMVLGVPSAAAFAGLIWPAVLIVLLGMLIVWLVAGRGK